jgi:hypothetical protein
MRGWLFQTNSLSFILPRPNLLQTAREKPSVLLQQGRLLR